MTQIDTSVYLFYLFNPLFKWYSTSSVYKNEHMQLSKCNTFILFALHVSKPVLHNKNTTVKHTGIKEK